MKSQYSYRTVTVLHDRQSAVNLDKPITAEEDERNVGESERILYNRTVAICTADLIIAVCLILHQDHQLKSLLKCELP